MTTARAPRGRPAVFLDRDGTLIEDRGHLSDPSEVAFYPGTAPALRGLGKHFVLFLVTQQSGVAHGLLAREDVDRVNAFVVERLAGEGVTIREVYCCPHAPEDGCPCIKPSPWFLLQAARDHGVDLEASYVVGDHPCDVELAANAGAGGFYVLTGHGARHRHQLGVPCRIVSGIAEAAEEIAVARAARILRAGGLVAFPTETVYGLGADARNAAAVRRVFQVKNRPPTHPLIVHLGTRDELDGWAADVPDLAARLAERFWPGPLTLILRRAPWVPDPVTGGQETVALRVPGHGLALRLLAETGRALAAPSANRFGRVSPTTADHVREDLGSEVEFVLDGGPCEVGLESTIVDLAGEQPVIVRPGGVAREAIAEVAGRPVPVGPTAARAPGSHACHYAPRARVRIVAAARVEEEAAALAARGLRVEVLTPESRTLYASLRDADRRGADVVVVSLPREEGLGLAVADRLKRASAGRRGRDPSPKAPPARRAGWPGPPPRRA